jgi:Pterin 4 alpha carbinolamine dehydratase
MSMEEAKRLHTTIHPDWKLHFREQNNAADDAGTATPPPPPVALVREFRHSDFRSGSLLIQKLSAVCELNNHYAKLILQRRISKTKTEGVQWEIVTTAHCQTTVLGGLSTEDFYLALLMGVEVARSEVCTSSSTLALRVTDERYDSTHQRSAPRQLKQTKKFVASDMW